MYNSLYIFIYIQLFNPSPGLECVPHLLNPLSAGAPGACALVSRGRLESESLAIPSTDFSVSLTLKKDNGQNWPLGKKLVCHVSLLVQSRPSPSLMPTWPILPAELDP